MFEKQQLQLRARGSRNAAAFLQALPELLTAVVAAYVAFRLLTFVAGDKLLATLRVLIFLLASVYWAIRFAEYRKAED